MYQSIIIVVSIVTLIVLGDPRAVLAQQVSGGIKAGPSLARLPGVADAVSEPVDEHGKWGVMAGGFVTIAINDRVAFQPEVLYAMKGTTLEAAAADVKLTFDARYLEFPLLLKFAPPSSPVYFLAGPAIAFRLSAKSREEAGGATVTEDLSDQAKRVDVGVAFGVGAAVGRFFVEGRWTEGLRDAESGDQFSTAVRHRVLGVLVGVRF